MHNLNENLQNIVLILIILVIFFKYIHNVLRFVKRIFRKKQDRLEYVINELSEIQSEIYELKQLTQSKKKKKCR